MYYLIDYNRTDGKLVSLQEFDSNQGDEARRARLTLEIELMRQRIAREVVLLEAARESDLRRTHRRYFEDLWDLTRECVAREA